MRTAKLLAGVALAFWAVGATPAAAAGQRVQLTGEIMDTWCYVSEIMGASEAVLGTAHHQCAVWCAAGGVPVGLLSEAGEIFMILKLGDQDTSNADPRILEIQSSRVTVDGDLYERDGIKYLLIDEVVANEGIVNRSHEDFGVIPAFGVPKQ
jgi:hypothetical protein